MNDCGCTLRNSISKEKRTNKILQNVASVIRKDFCLKRTKAKKAVESELFIAEFMVLNLKIITLKNLVPLIRIDDLLISLTLQLIPRNLFVCILCGEANPAFLGHLFKQRVISDQGQS